ncbi:G-protein coupled receptor 84-like [Lytechinus variegatus]|uniref:G-protein coupled receptor 84-like n=1 Tax=Lytechinus variegatus TaxID=7654 RepID=UPI001BB1D3F8|nr:G-protein coupled receptor 84-like [Lytechinus variegatus]
MIVKAKPRSHAAGRNEDDIATTDDERDDSGSVNDPSDANKDQPSSQTTCNTNLDVEDAIELSPRTEGGQPACGNGPCRQRRKDDASQRTATLAVIKSLLVVLVVFIICFIPYPFTVWLDPRDILGVHRWGVALIFFNSCVNPIIYAGKIRAFREVMVFIITCRYKRIPMPVEWLRRMRDAG